MSPFTRSSALAIKNERVKIALNKKKLYLEAIKRVLGNLESYKGTRKVLPWLVKGRIKRGHKAMRLVGTLKDRLIVTCLEQFQDYEEKKEDFLTKKKEHAQKHKAVGKMFNELIKISRSRYQVTRSKIHELMTQVEASKRAKTMRQDACQVAIQKKKACVEVFKEMNKINECSLALKYEVLTWEKVNLCGGFIRLPKVRYLAKRCDEELASVNEKLILF